MRNKVIFLLVCGILTGAGMVMAGIGAAMGGMIYGVAINTHGIRVNAPLLQQGGKENKTKNQTEVTEALTAFDSIEVDVSYADIFIEQSDADQYSLTYSLTDSGNLRKEVTDRKLVLKYEEDHSFGWHQNSIQWFVFGRIMTGNEQNDYVRISLPKGVKCKDVVLNTESADTACTNIQADGLKMRADYGDASLLGVNARQMELHLESGKLRMEQIQGESCTITDDYGDAILYDAALEKDLTVHMESGNLRFRNVSVQDLYVNSEYGDIDGEQIEFADAQISLESGDCKLNDVLLETCNMSAEYGDVELKLRKEPADYSYDLHAEYGDIKIAGEKMGESCRSYGKNPDSQIVIVCETGDIKIQ